MPKVRRVQSPSSYNSTRSYPYASNLQKPKNLLGSVEDLKEWEEVRCPICMEPPHNAVVLKCSSYEMGCRPYMCNTGYRHSNCLDQFCKSVTPHHLPAAILQEIPLTNATSHRSRWESQLQAKLICPLCRGQIYGYMVLEPARRYMNTKPRSCSCETCEFQGTYSELREHARSEHPSVRPWEVDPSRQHDWIRMEQERDYEDVLSSIHSDRGAEYSREDLTDFLDESIFYIDEVYEMTSSLAYLRDLDDTQTNQSPALARLPPLVEVDSRRSSPEVMISSTRMVRSWHFW